MATITLIVRLSPGVRQPFELGEGEDVYSLIALMKAGQFIPEINEHGAPIDYALYRGRAYPAYISAGMQPDPELIQKTRRLDQIKLGEDEELYVADKHNPWWLISLPTQYFAAPSISTQVFPSQAIPNAHAQSGPTTIFPSELIPSWFSSGRNDPTQVFPIEDRPAVGATIPLQQQALPGQGPRACRVTLARGCSVEAEPDGLSIGRDYLLKTLPARIVQLEKIKVFLGLSSPLTYVTRGPHCLVYYLNDYWMLKAYSPLLMNGRLLESGNITLPDSAEVLLGSNGKGWTIQIDLG